MVLSNLSVSDVSIYFVWLTALLVVRDELEHLWRHTYIPIRCRSTEVNIPSSCASALARRQVLDWMPSSHTAPTVKNRLCIYYPHNCYKPPISQYNR